MDFFHFFMVPLMMQSSVELYVIISVACFGFPISLRFVLIVSIYLTLYNNTPHSASAADDITLCMMVKMTIIDPFGRLLSSFVPLMYKKPPALLLAKDSDKYDASLCALSTILLAFYLIVSLGYVAQ